MRKVGLVSIILMLVLTLVAPVVCGDGGIIGPPQIYIYERAQNAIVAWNGTEEVLILSIDIDSSEPTKVLRVIPLPSNPINVSEGSFDSFTKLQEIVNEKLLDAWNYSRMKSGGYGEDALAPSSNVEVTFQDTIGAHNITIFHILNGTNFSDYATDFAVQAGLNDIIFSSKFQSMVEEYLDDDISHFVFDIIDTTEAEHSVSPIIYRFKTDFLFYPLKITAASDVGETYAEVNVFCIAKERIKEEVFSDISFYSNLGGYWYEDLTNINLTEDELLEISPEIYDIFKGDPILMSYQYYGKYSSLDEDIIASAEDFAYPSLEIIAEDHILVERDEKSIVNVTVRNTGNTDLQIRLGIDGGLGWIQHSWYSVSPYSATINEGGEYTFEISFDIPSNIQLGDYSLTYTASSSMYNVEKQKSTTMTVYDAIELSELSNEIRDLTARMDVLLAISIICFLLIGTIILVILFIMVKRK